MTSRHILSVALAALTTASFGSISIRFDSTGLGESIDYVYNGSSASGFAGQLNFTDLTHNTAFTSYCVDLDHHISGGSTYDVDLQPTIGNQVYQLAGSICSNSFGAANTNASAAALEIAIWAARYGCDLTTNSGGTFHLDGNWYANNSSIVNMAVSMTALGQNNLMDAELLMPRPVDGGQAQLRPVPEPGSIVALGIGAATLLKRRKRA